MRILPALIDWQSSINTHPPFGHSDSPFLPLAAGIE
jgi:hypothetical protein